MRFQRSQNTGGPSSSVGITRFFDTDMSGPKMTPEFVLGLSVAFIILMFALKMLALF
jgi:preprotein translocase subunit Sec61beta